LADVDTKRKIIYKYFRKTEIAIFALFFLLPIFLINYQSVKGAFVSSNNFNEESYSVVIKDGEKLTYGRALSKDERESLDQNKISHWPEDIISSELILDPVRYQGAGRLIEINRAPVYYIIVDRKLIEVRDWDGEVGGIIKKGNVSLNPNDIVSHNLSSKLTNGAEINITRINYAEVTETETIDFNMVYRASTALALRKTRDEVSGIRGEKKLTYKITYKDGKEVSRVLVGSSVIKQKRDAVILRGAVSGVCKWGPYYETNFGPYTTSFHYPGYVGRYALVTNLANNKSVRVKIVDVGPTNGLLDLSTTAMREIGGPLATFHGSIPSVMVQILD
jgi:hypothetical protein